MMPEGRPGLAVLLVGPLSLSLAGARHAYSNETNEEGMPAGADGTAGAVTKIERRSSSGVVSVHAARAHVTCRISKPGYSLHVG